MRTLRFLFLLAFGLSGGVPATAGTAVGQTMPLTTAGAAAVGSQAPALPLTTLDGSSVRALRGTGNVTVVNFWATWCPPCRAETPDLIAAYEKLHASGVRFLGVDTTETAPIVKTFISAKGVPFQTALAGPSVYNAYAIAYIPTTIVVDARGIIRARWVGGVTPSQLSHYIADARAGRSSTYISPAQARIDALLSPARFSFRGSPAQIEADVRSMMHAIARAEDIAEHDSASVDYERTQRAEGALSIAAGSAQRSVATTAAAKSAGLVLLARGFGDVNRWSAAAQAYRSALALTPNQPKLVAALSRAYYRLHDYHGMIVQALRFTELQPRDGDGWSDLGLSYQRARRFAQAAPAYEKSLALLGAQARAKPSQDAFADVADTALDTADVYVSLADREGARRSFALANAYGDRLASPGRYSGLKRNVKERTQEGLVAVAVAGGGMRHPLVSVTPWTGADLPGSLASTLKYRLIVAARADAAVTLEAKNLRPQWVASFCADGLCSPQTVSFRSPASGVKTYEFQLVPPHDGDEPGNIAIAVAGGGSAVAVPVANRARRP